MSTGQSHLKNGVKTPCWDGEFSGVGMSPSDNRIYKGWIHFTVHYIMGNSIIGPSKGVLVGLSFREPRFLIGTKRKHCDRVM